MNTNQRRAGTEHRPITAADVARYLARKGVAA